MKYSELKSYLELALSSDRKDTEYFKTIFTESEISQMDITGFEKIEVTP